jgi:tellurite methyltransferase
MGQEGATGSVWRPYYDRTRGRPPRETLLLALERFEAEGPAGRARFAVDLGCGTGRDTIELLRPGWRVLAIDAEPEAIAGLRARADLPPGARLEVRIARFERARWPEADLVNASFALPFCPPAAFPGVWWRIVRSLRPGGRFTGQLLGDGDSWAREPGITHFHAAELDELLAGLEVEHLWEEEADSVTPRGEAKHWHVFHVVARRP